MAKRVHHRKKPRFRRQSRPGAVPGTIHVSPESPRPVIHVMAYDHDEVAEYEIDDLDDLPEIIRQHRVSWINVDGLGDADTLRRLGKQFHLHALALEDVVNVHQRAKVESYDNHLFIVTRMIKMVDEELDTEQVSIFLGENYVLTFQEQAGDCFDPVRNRIRNSRGMVRKSGSDYLAYALLDAVIDSYFPPADQFADQLDKLEVEVGDRPDASLVARIHDVRHDLLLLRRSIRPHREALNELVRDATSLISDATAGFSRLQ